MRTLTPDMAALIADRFRTLGEPSRLALLQALRAGERSVSELVEDLALGQANVSKHLQQLFRHGFVTRRKEGVTVFYRIADPSVFKLCDIVCGGLEAEVRSRGRALGRR